MADGHTTHGSLQIQGIIPCEMPTDGRFTDLTGRDFGGSIVISFAGRKGRKLYWLVRCLCGCEFAAESRAIRCQPHVKCKTCLSQERKSQFLKIKRCGREKTHPLNTSKEHGIWAAMLSRCRNPNIPEFVRY